MFEQGKKKSRQELQLPILRYVAADDWIDKIGPSAFVGWLKFITWVDRTDVARKKSDYDIIPNSLEKVAEKLGISKPTLYKKIITPLWEYGFIDLVEYKESERKSQKPINIIVYEYPQNNIELSHKPLVKCRDWKTDYNSQSQIFARLRGNKKKDEVTKRRYKLHRKNILTVHRKENLTVENDRKENLTVGEYRKNNLTVTVKKSLPNNVSNISNNVSNDDELIKNNILTDNELMKFDIMQQEKPFQFDEIAFKRFEAVFGDFKGWNKKRFQAIKKEMIEKKLSSFTLNEAMEQNIKMLDIAKIKPITSFHTYFVNGIILARENGEVEESVIEQEPEVETELPRVAFYNWLDERE